MSSQTLRIVIPAVLILHGIGHWMGILTAGGLIKTDSWNSHIYMGFSQSYRLWNVASFLYHSFCETA